MVYGFDSHVAFARKSLIATACEIAKISQERDQVHCRSAIESGDDKNCEQPYDDHGQHVGGYPQER
jgi:hypothetical protein